MRASHHLNLSELKHTHEKKYVLKVAVKLCFTVYQWVSVSIITNPELLNQTWELSPPSASGLYSKCADPHHADLEVIKC